MANKELKKEIAGALDNEILRGALGRFSEQYPIAREKAYIGYDFEDLRSKVHEVKTYAAEHIDELLDEFEKNATAKGAKVYRAANAKEATEYVKQLALSKNIKNIVKSKSMASEEIKLNDVLKDAGMDVQETDLGEFIIALAGQHPSHMVMPAIHMTKEQVAELFTNYTHEKNDPVISQLVKTAREFMRKKFIDAQMGISGSNIAVAETGTLFMVTNEGNGRLTSTLPPVHVYIVGIEKFVAKFKDIKPILKVLPRNGTGQNITTYVSAYTGATDAYLEDGTVGKKDIHIVILDNGRREILNDEKFRQMYSCIRCAACLNVCPAFGLLGGHVYGGNTYTGGIGTLLTAFLTSDKEAEKVQNLCLQCGKCTQVCAGKLNIPEMILELRNRYGERNMPFTYKFALDIVSNRRLFHSMLRAASIAQKPVARGGKFIRHLPFFLSGLTDGKSLPAVAEKPFRDIFPTIKQEVPNKKGTIAIYAGCLLDFVYPAIGEGMISALNELGYKVIFPENQSCCGAPANYLGDRDNLVKSAILNINGINAEEVDYVVSACPTCTHALKESYKEIVSDNPKILKRAEVLSEKIFDFSKLVTMLGGLESKGDGKQLKVTYHDSCHLKRKMGVYKEQRELLKNTKGIELVEMKDCDSCCGFAGSYSVKFPEISSRILQKKIKNILATDAEVVAVDCPGCLMQISGGLDYTKFGVKVMHTAELLNKKRNGE